MRERCWAKNGSMSEFGWFFGGANRRLVVQLHAACIYVGDTQRNRCTSTWFTAIVLVVPGKECQCQVLGTRGSKLAA